MVHARLEIDEIQIYKGRRNWKLYFIVLAEHPTEPDKMIMTTIPQEPFKLSKRHNNSFSFDTNQAGSEGLFVLSRELPENREINVHFYLRHSKKGLRDLGEILQDIESGIGGYSFGIVTDIVGTTTVPWLVLAKKAIPLIGRLLAKSKDKDFGFLSAFERFGSEFEVEKDISRKKDFSGDAAMIYSWTMDDDQLKNNMA